MTFSAALLLISIKKKRTFNLLSGPEGFFNPSVQTLEPLKTNLLGRLFFQIFRPKPALSVRIGF